MRVVYVLTSVVLVLLVLSPVASLGGDIYSKLYELYVRTAELSLKGIETGKLEELLASAVDLIESGDYSKALEVMSEVEKYLFELESRAGTIMLEKSLVKYGTAVAVASIPLLIYLLLPRLYIYLWYTTRRNWVVASERPR